MNKVANSYSLNNRVAAQRHTSLISRPGGTSARKYPMFAPGRAEVRERIAKRAERRRKGFLPHWIIFTFVLAFTFTFCAIVNVKTRTEMQTELQQQQLLHTEIKKLENENIELADEVRRLQSDPVTIERAARERLNMARPDEKIYVSAR